MQRHSLTFAATLILSLLSTTTPAATTTVDTIIHDGTNWITTPNIVGIPAPLDIETYNGYSEFVAVGPFVPRNYYISGGNWIYNNMAGATDYTRIANGNGAALGFFYGMSSNGSRIDRINNNTATLTSDVVPGLTGLKAIEAYAPFNDDILTVSAEGVYEHYGYNGTIFESSDQVSADTDYIELANNGNASGRFFALGSDGRVDELVNSGTWSTTNILAPGTLTNPKYIESYDSNNEFVTVSSQGVREYYFSEGNWVVDPMSSSPDYIAVVDNAEAGANYWALSVVVPEPSSLCLFGFGLVGLSAVRARRRRNSAA